MIKVGPKLINDPEPDYKIERRDMEFLKQVKEKMGTVSAIRVLRLMVPCGLITAKQFVDTL